MGKSSLNIKLFNIRAIKKADIKLEGITVIAGENGCGKSTISRLTYNIIKGSLDYDKLIDEKIRSELDIVYNTLDILSRDLSYFLSKNEYLTTRNYFRKLYREEEQQLKLFGEDNTLVIIIEYLIKIFKDLSNAPIKKQTLTRLDRIKRILEESLFPDTINKGTDIVKLLEKLKTYVKNFYIKKENLKEIRPISILYENLDNVFYDAPLPRSFNIFEYGIPIIDEKKNKLSPIHSVINIAYIDTPMILGIDFIGERNHWDDINALIKSKKQIHRTDKQINYILNKEVIKGDINIEEEESLSDKTFVYKRNDGKEFDLLECATGLKSFAILQLLYKNGFFSNKTLLIIDEPEAHLHPQWVVEYARLIVLINKHLGTKFLIASHHPDIISAIKYISEKENVSSNLNFYLAKKLEESYLYSYKLLGREIEEIFESFNIALERIDLYGTTR